MWWILIGLSMCTQARGFAGGFFPQSCGSMSPQHRRRSGGNYAPQGTEPPFEVDYQHGKNGGPITVFLRSTGSTTFEGFMLQARRKGMVDDGRPVGKFVMLDSNIRLLRCNGVDGSAVSQRNNRLKTSIQVNWTAEGEDLDITFRATFVEVFDRFWERVDVNVTLPTPTPPPPPTTTTPTQPSTTTSTAKPSTTTSTAKPSTTPSTAKPSTTTRTTEPSTTEDTTVPSTTKASATESSMTSSSHIIPSITFSTTRSNPQREPRASNLTLQQAATTLMGFDILVTAVKMELPNIFMTTLVASPFSRGLIKVSKILCSLLSAALEILTLILFCVGDSLNVSLIAVVCVVIAVNFIELVIVSLAIGPSHELKEICDIAVKVCSVIHTILATFVIFVGVLGIDGCVKNRRESWLLKVMIAYTVWIFLFVVWTFVFSIHRNVMLGGSKIGSSKYNNGQGQRRKTKELSAATVTVNAIQVIFIVGTMSFTAALIVGIFSEKQPCA